jgi:AraC-like DNA-binding protein
MDDLLAAMEAVEQAAGARLRFHDYTGQVEAVVGKARIHHDHPVCRRIKAVDPGLCTSVDLVRCGRRLRADRGGFWKSCHGGLLEVCIPLRDDERILGVLFLGPWCDEGAGEVAAGPRHRLAATGADRLPDLPRAQRAHVQGLAWLAAQAVAAAAAARPAHAEDRQARIRRLVDTYACSGLELGTLAADLGLSAARTGAVVRVLFGCTFPQLITAARLTRACSLLAGTALTVAEVAQRCGFADAAHLHRRFRAAHGCTPEAWRRGKHPPR